MKALYVWVTASFSLMGLLAIPAFASPSDDCAAILTSQANALKMYEERGSEKDKLFVEEPHHIRIRVGMPSTLKIVSPHGKTFRHYTSQAGLKKILDSKRLQAGWTPFYYSGSLSDYNESLTGIFITTPDVAPYSIGVRAENSAYVDFKLNDATGILFLRDGIMLIPGEGKPEGWKVDVYKNGQRATYTGYEEEFARWDIEGIPQPLEMPIEIIGHSK